jgi:hypothetical protein
VNYSGDDCPQKEETVWLSQAQMSELFQTTKQNVSLHIQNVFIEQELQRGATVKEYLTVQQEGTRAVRRNVESIFTIPKINRIIFNPWS